VQITQDSLGNLIEVTNFNVAGQPTNSAAGVARVTRVYDAVGNLREEHFFDAQGQPIRLEGCETSRSDYDEHGRIASIICLDVQSRLVRNSEEFAEIRYSYDRANHVTTISYFDEQGRPCPHNDGNYKVRMVYNAIGDEIERDFLDLADHLMPKNDGVARIRQKYDSNGDVVERSFFNATGGPVHRGALISMIQPSSQAEKVGLQVGDTIMVYDGNSLDLDLREQTSRPGVGKRKILVFRDGHSIEIAVDPGPLGVQFTWRFFDGELPVAIK
jgi:hypothetical protein